VVMKSLSWMCVGGGGTLAGRGSVKRPGFRARDSLSLRRNNNRDGVCGNGVPVASGVVTTGTPLVNPLPVPRARGRFVSAARIGLSGRQFGQCYSSVGAPAAGATVISTHLPLGVRRTA
jgi:hypothetical protein